MAEKSLTEKLNQLNISVLDAFNLSTEKDIISEFVKAGIKVLGADFGYSFIKSPGSTKFSLIYITPGVNYKPISKPRKQGIVAKAFSTRQPQLISSVSKTDFIRYDAKSAMESVAVVPITHKNNTYGTLHFAYNKSHEFTEEEKNLYAYIGNSAAQAITINRLYNDLKDFKTTLDNTLDGIVIFDPETLKIQYANNGTLTFLKKSRTAIVKKTLYDAVPGLNEEYIRLKMADIIEHPDLDFLVFDATLDIGDKKKIPVEISLQHISQKNQPEKFLAIIRDITERKQNEISIKKMAYFDTVTGIPNRALMNERLAEEHDRAKDNNGMYAVFFIDLDRFKIINDIYGHQLGDDLLKEVARRLTKAIPKKATVARMGGDEFTVLLPDIKSVTEAEKTARDILETFTTFFQIDEHELYANGSVGFAMFPFDGMDYHVVMKNADLALSRAKEHGGANFQQYRMGQPLFYTMQPKLQNQLRQAIKKGELELHYQPIINVVTQRITSCESLIRWNHPEMGLLYPTDFIGQAEESGLIVELGEWVFEEVCKQIQAWSVEGHMPPPVSINVSPRELLRPTLVSNMERALKKYKVSASQIKLELTETFLMKNIDMSIAILEQLKALGLQILIDDFGTGYASLNYLRMLPINGVKIDQSFIKGVPGNLQDTALTSAIIAISHQLGLDVVAEGVETLKQFEFLRDADCNYAQGKFFFKALSADQFADMLHLTHST